MANPGDVVEAPLFGARATFLETTEQTGGALLRVEVVLPPGFSVAEHVHPVLEERHRVVRGTLRARVGGQEAEYGVGELAVGPAGVPHAWTNPSDHEELCLVSEHRPALRMEELLEGGFTIARDLEADRWGAPKHLLRLAVLLDDVREDFRMTRVPARVILRAFAAIAPIGRLLGYEPIRSTPRRNASRKRLTASIAAGSVVALILTALVALWWRHRPRLG